MFIEHLRLPIECVFVGNKVEITSELIWKVPCVLSRDPETSWLVFRQFNSFLEKT